MAGRQILFTVNKITVLGAAVAAENLHAEVAAAPLTQSCTSVVYVHGHVLTRGAHGNVLTKGELKVGRVLNVTVPSVQAPVT